MMPDRLDAASAFARYVEVAPRLPSTDSFPEQSIHRANLGELVDDIDVFVLDGFGVLNVGFDPVAHAARRLTELRDAGCVLRVLTNGATQPSSVTHAKYQRWQMDLAADEVISSRDALARGLSRYGDDLEWGFMARSVSELHTLTPRHRLLEDNPEDYRAVDGIVLLGSGEWTEARHAMLCSSLTERSRPVLVGNPDLVAPFVGEFSLEPGLYAHDLADAGLATPEFFGKPFANAFELVAETLTGVDPQRIAMVGDTLHTDILGGAAAGWKTVLITGLGLMRELDVESGIAESGVRPDYIVETT